MPGLFEKAFKTCAVAGLQPPQRAGQGAGIGTGAPSPAVSDKEPGHVLHEFPSRRQPGVAGWGPAEEEGIRVGGGVGVECIEAGHCLVRQAAEVDVQRHRVVLEVRRRLSRVCTLARVGRRVGRSTADVLPGAVRNG